MLLVSCRYLLVDNPDNHFKKIKLKKKNTHKQKKTSKQVVLSCLSNLTSYKLNKKTQSMEKFRQGKNVHLHKEAAMLLGGLWQEYQTNWVF